MIIGDICAHCLRKPCECPVDDSAAREIFAKVAEGRPLATGGAAPDYRDRIAELERRVAEAERTGAVKALREAAVDWARHPHFADWLVVRANRIEGAER